MTRKTPPKTPPRASKSTRSGSKTREAPAGRRTTGYPEATRAKALALLERDGMAATHKATSIPKPTLTRWAKAAGIDLGEQARARTSNATEAVRARAAEVTANTVELLEGHIAQAGHYLGTLAGVNARAAQLIAAADPDTITINQGIAGPYAVVTDPAAQELGKVALALAGLPLAPRDAEGILTRAIHDLQLLKGEATERGDLRVEFNVPRPPSSTSATVVEVPAIEN